MPKKVKIIEVGPRDGLQNEKKIVPVADKIQFIKLLSEAGFQEIEAGAFVSPKWVPQMVDSRAVFESLDLQSGITYTALVPNEKGMATALEAGVKKIAVFTAASETFNQKNINASIAESIQRFEPVVKMARVNHVEVRGYVSTAFVCPYEGDIQVSAVADVVQKLFDLGIHDISLGDTIGKATSEQVQNLLTLLLKKYPVGVFAMHFHDTFGRALQNIGESLKFDISCFDSSAGGLGGCPYAPGAKGNVSTNSLVKFFDQKKITHGINLKKLETACEFIGKILGRKLT